MRFQSLVCSVSVVCVFVATGEANCLLAQQSAVDAKASSTNTASFSEAAKFLPPTTAIFANLPDPDGLVTALLEHPVHARIQADAVAGAVYKSPQVMQLKAGIALVELQMGMSYYELVKSVGGDGATAAFDPETNGAALLLNSPDPEKQRKTLQRIIGLVKKQRRNNDQSEIKSDVYRDVKVYQLNQVRFAALDGWILLTNKNELGKFIVDATLDHPQDTLSAADWFQKASSQFSDDVVAQATVNLQEVRDRGGMQKVLEGTKGNPVAEFLLGGVFENLAHSEFACASLNLDDTSIRLGFYSPHDQKWIPESREFFFGPGGAGVAKAPIAAEQSVLNISAYRDIAKMWLYGGDLFNQKVNDGMAEAESNLSTLFAGRDFVEEVLGLIKPEVQLVVRKQSFEQLPTPALKLPSFALVGELKDPEVMRDELRRTYQSVIGFFNVIGAMEGNPQLDQDILNVGEAKIMTSRFIPTPENKKSTAASIHYNFSPTLALTGQHFVLASSLPLAKELVKNVGTAKAADPESSNARIALKASPLKSILEDNREFLISNNMLEEGNTRAEAEVEIGLLLTIVGLFDGVDAKLVPSDGDLRLDLDLTLAK